MRNMEIPDFEFFIDREKNKPCLVAGNAPTLRNFPFKKFKGKYLLMNRTPLTLRKLAIPDYWFSANYWFPVPNLHLKKINAFEDCVFVFSDTAVYTAEHIYDYDFLKNNLKVRWFAFDDRHFGHKKCNPPRPCCKLVALYPERSTIYEFIQQYFGLSERCPTVNTGVFFSLAFAVLMGCCPIYLQGIELPIYYEDYLPYNMLHPQNARLMYHVFRAYVKKWIYGVREYSPFYEICDQTLVAFEYMVNLCHKRGIEIYNLSPTSTLNRIKVLPYLDHKKVCRQEYSTLF